MLELIAQNMSIFWIALVIIFAVVEALTAGLTCIWFGVGALAALVSSFFSAAIWLQFVWFFIISIASLLLTRPLVRKYVDTVKQPTNADMVIGKTALVTEDIDNIAAAGAVSVGGKEWTARSDTGVRILSGEVVTVLRIDGVKLIVSPAGSAEGGDDR